MTDMKTCAKCKTEKPVEKFARDARKRGGYSSRCLSCAAAAQKAYHDSPKGRAAIRDQRIRRRAVLRELVNSHKNVPCTDCGQRFPLICMDFDHLGAEPKEDEISTMVHRLTSEKRILAEIAKCEVVCSNCHRVRTLERGQHGRAV